MNWDAVVGVIAVLALIQPWLLAAYRRLFQPGHVVIHETGTIDVSFFTAGPTITLQGALQALHRDQFIQSMQLDVVRERDHAQSHMDWIALRPTQIVLGRANQQPMTVELPFGFMLLTSSAGRFNILFGDRTVGQQIAHKLDGLLREWNQLTSTAIDRNIVQRAIQGDSEAAHALEEARRTVYETKFKSSLIYTDTWGAVERLSFWEAGPYRLTLSVVTSRPKRTFTKSWRFELSEQDSKNLRLNTFSHLDAAVNLHSSGPFYSAFVPYQEP